MNYISKLYTNFTLISLIVLTSIIFISCSKVADKQAKQPEPGRSLGIASVPNLRDLGGYKTTSGATIANGLVFRANQLFNVSAGDMLKIEKLNLKNVFDLRTAAEKNPAPDELPAGVKNVWLDVLADVPSSGPANLTSLLTDPKKANIELGDGKVEALFKQAYRDCISLPSAKTNFRKLFLSLADTNQLPALFHCATGKDRTGWAAAALLTLLGVPREVVMQDYLRSNEYILPMYDTLIQKFVTAGGSKSIPLAIFGVREEYLNAAFDEVQTKYGSIEKYFSEGLGITVEQQTAMRKLYLKD